MKNEALHENLPPVDISEARNMLKNARKALYKGRIISAEVYARQAKEKGLEALASYENAVERLYQTKKIIERASLNGIDTHRAMDHMNRAIIALNEAQYERVPEYCRMAFLACQPEPEPGRDFSLETHFHGVQVSEFEMVYNLTISVENQTPIPIEDLTIKVPEEIASIFEARNSKRRLSVKGNETKRVTFVFEPSPKIDDFAGLIMGRDIEIKTTLTTHEDNLVYMVELINTSREVISSLSISPPYRKGFIPSPESYTFNDIEPDTSELAHFKLTPEKIHRSDFSKPESEFVEYDGDKDMTEEGEVQGEEKEEELTMDSDINGPENDVWIPATSVIRKETEIASEKKAIPVAHTGQNHIGIWGRNLADTGSRIETSSPHDDGREDISVSSYGEMDVNVENIESLDQVIHTSNMNNPFIDIAVSSENPGEKPREYIQPNSATNIDGTDGDHTHTSSEDDDWMLSDDDLIPFTAIRKDGNDEAQNKGIKENRREPSYNPLPPDPESLDSRIRELMKKVHIVKENGSEGSNSRSHQNNHVDTTNQK